MKSSGYFIINPPPLTMTSSKVVVYGNTTLSAEQLNVLHSRSVEITPIPENYPAERLEFLAPFQLVLLNFASESEDDLERIRAVRRNFSMVPMILASKNPSASYLVQAYRHGITDCLLAPFSEEQLTTLIFTYLKNPSATGSYALGLLPEAFRNNTFSARRKESDLYVQFLGTLRLSRHGKRLDPPNGARQRSLLAYLLYHSQSPVHRERIIRRFWPDHDSDCAKNNLNVAICNLRRYLEPHFQQEVICFQNGYFYINPDLVVGRDMDDFLFHYHQGKNAESHGDEAQAAQWYRTTAQMGTEFLEEFFQEDWTIRPREEFVEKYFHALDYLGTYHLRRKNYELAIETLRQMLYKDECLETVHRKIISSYLALGKKEKAIRQYQECERILAEKLDMRPSAEMNELLRSVKG